MRNQLLLTVTLLALLGAAALLVGTRPPGRNGKDATVGLSTPPPARSP